IEKAIEDGIEIVVVPGPSALIAAISLSGLPIREFTFIGFLPQKRNQRRKTLSELATEKRTLVFYEAPHRIFETVEDMAEIFGERRVALVKEITKIHEEVLRGNLLDLSGVLTERTIAGEYVMIVQGAAGEAASLDDAVKEMFVLMKRGKSRKEAARTVSEQYGLSKNELYDRSLGE
ncbi:MAG TPA: SAM-dependent methyltransferase, partial [Thermodesulfovibrionales bacterium]|nr:SAM-dependent methyltransferase [Thermodesulfovibrionales bacterium]